MSKVSIRPEKCPNCEKYKNKRWRKTRIAPIWSRGYVESAIWKCENCGHQWFVPAKEDEE